MKYISLSLLFFSLIGYGQKLRVGDSLPDFEFSNMVNYRSTSMKLSELNKKLVLLDFWNHRCLACIKAFPKLDSLQKKFKESVQIILVNTEGKDSTLRFFSEHSRIVMPSIPMITQDTTLVKLFPLDGYPYNVWLEGNRKIRYISGGYNTTTEHILSFLKGVNLGLKNTAIHKTYGSAITNINANLEQQVEFLSYISRCNDTLMVSNAEGAMIKEGTALRLSSNCASIVDLYKKAYREYDRYDFNTTYGVELNVTDSFKYVRPRNNNLLDSWSKKNSFNYELILPISLKQKMYKIMQTDLSHYFPLSAYVTKKKVTGFRLLQIDSLNGILSKAQPDKSSAINEKRFVKFLKNISLSEFVTRLKSWLQPAYPLQNSVSSTNSCCFEIRETSIFPLNVQELRNDLRRHNLELIEEEMEVDVLILSEDNASERSMEKQ